MERVVLPRLEWFLEKRGLYPDTVTGFRKGRSSIQSVIDLVNNIFVNEKHHLYVTAATFLDITGVVDNVILDAISDSLDYFGIRGRLHH